MGGRKGETEKVEQKGSREIRRRIKEKDNQ
jgi:hypothetical protein